jgi:hypothetical protein
LAICCSLKVSLRCGLCAPKALTKRVTCGASGQIEYSLLASAANSEIWGCVAMTWYASAKASITTFQLAGTSFTAWKAL